MQLINLTFELSENEKRMFQLINDCYRRIYHIENKITYNRISWLRFFKEEEENDYFIALRFARKMQDKRFITTDMCEGKIFSVMRMCEKIAAYACQV